MATLRLWTVLAFAWVALFATFTTAAANSALGDKYLLGAGKADITGPVTELPFMGYASLEQKGTGLKQRIYSRSFIVGSTTKPEDRILYIILDIGTGDTALRYGILDGLKQLGAGYEHYTQSNVAVTGTHSHSGPGGWNNYVLPQIAALGFNKQSYQAVVDGAVLSVKRAHEALTEGYLDVGTTDVKDGNINRSLWAYLNNPEAERNQYGASTDTLMTLMRFRRADNLNQFAVLNWYAVHGTSAYNNNTLVSGDNKGVAAWLLEREMGNNFVAGFSQANVGDVSPNVGGQWCEDGSNKECTLDKSTCADGKITNCRGRGPAFTVKDNGLSSAYEMGRRQYASAKDIMGSLDNAGTQVVGPTVKSFHFFHDMRYWKFPLADGTEVQTCPAALGYSFAAGTTDGPGVGDFIQSDAGAPDANPFWKFVSGAIKSPTQAQKDCQGAKPILLDVGEIDWPFAWTANIVDVQVLRVGQLVIIVSPAEATTMSGRRWRKAVGNAAKSIIDTEPIVVIGGPANTYTHYCVTPEEYDIQRYEGASTLFGRHTLDAYINLTTSHISYLSPDSTRSPDPGPPAPDNRGKGLSFLTDVVYDNQPIGKPFGTVLTKPPVTVARGSTVVVKFQGANPRNNLRLEGTYAAVEKQNGDGSWTQVRNDADWFIQYEWKRTDLVLGYSEVTITWDTNEAGSPVEPGTYRIKYYGDRKVPVTAKINAFEGTTAGFTIA